VTLDSRDRAARPRGSDAASAVSHPKRTRHNAAGRRQTPRVVCYTFGAALIPFPPTLPKAGPLQSQSLSKIASGLMAGLVVWCGVVCLPPKRVAPRGAVAGLPLATAARRRRSTDQHGSVAGTGSSGSSRVQERPPARGAPAGGRPRASAAALPPPPSARAAGVRAQQNGERQAAAARCARRGLPGSAARRRSPCRSRRWVSATSEARQRATPSGPAGRAAKGGEGVEEVGAPPSVQAQASQPGRWVRGWLVLVPKGVRGATEAATGRGRWRSPRWRARQGAQTASGLARRRSRRGAVV
jgi:hypothetical protein